MPDRRHSPTVGCPALRDTRLRPDLVRQRIHSGILFIIILAEEDLENAQLDPVILCRQADREDQDEREDPGGDKRVDAAEGEVDDVLGKVGGLQSDYRRKDTAEDNTADPAWEQVSRCVNRGIVSGDQVGAGRPGRCPQIFLLEVPVFLE